MHRIAIRGPQCVRHQLFAMLPIWMVDGESVWQELYPRGCGGLGLAGCFYCRCLVEVWNCAHVDISLGHADGKRARYGNAQAIIRFDEPVQFQLSGFLACNGAESPVASAMGGLTKWAVLQIAR